MAVFRMLFPASTRTFPGKRWVNISLRTLHLIGITGLGGQIFFSLEGAQVAPFWVLSVLSGLGMVGIALIGNGIWLLQVRGLAVLTKLLIILALGLVPQWQQPLFVMILLISGLISHAPGSVRYYSPWHGRRIDVL